MKPITKNDLIIISTKFIYDDDNSDLWFSEVDKLHSKDKYFYCNKCKKYFNKYDVSSSEDGKSIWCDECDNKIL